MQLDEYMLSQAKREKTDWEKKYEDLKADVLEHNKAVTEHQYEMNKVIKDQQVKIANQANLR